MGYGLVPLRVQVVQSYDSYPQVNVTATKRGLIEHGVLNQNKHFYHFYTIQAEGSVFALDQLMDSNLGMLLPHQKKSFQQKTRDFSPDVSQGTRHSCQLKYRPSTNWDELVLHRDDLKSEKLGAIFFHGLFLVRVSCIFRGRFR